MSDPLPSPDYTRVIVGGFRAHPLGRALGLHRRSGAELADEPTRVLDACGGYGEDGYLMAAWGCDVTTCERHADVYATLAAAIEQATACGVAGRPLKGRWALRHGDARDLLAAAPVPFDAVYLDPMFSHRADRRALEGKAMRDLRALVGDDPDAVDLLHAALAAAGRSPSLRRVIVKRPRRVAPLAELPPQVTQQGKAVRYDVHIVP